ncbi:hypothetical protein CMI37_02675 [Candidatus Pacearchaeota archaeon]|nr:hypothetical protein [Candidatus Pacearchaeota archaeon]|tara:strand:- start:645 stop:1133 length:489 start_codon:yes stop_codon:yes gene_type:complete
MQLAQIAKIVTCVAAIDVGGVARLGAHINMSKYEHVAFIISIGAIGNACTVTVLAGTDSVGTGGVAMGYSYYLSTGGAPLVGEVASAKVTVGAGGYTLAAATDDNETMVIEIDADQLVAPTLKYYVGVNLSGAAACLASVIGVALWPRYAANPALMPSAIVD